MNINVNSNSPSTGTCLDRYLNSFEDGLTARQYTARTIKTYRVLVRSLAGMMEKRGIEPEQLTTELTAELIRDEKVRHLHRSGHVVRRFVERLIKIGVARAAALTPKQAGRAKLRREFEDYLRRDRGLSERSIYDCWRMADRFLDHRFGDQADELGEAPQ